MAIKKFNEYNQINEWNDNISNEEKIAFLERTKSNLAAFRKAYFDLAYTWGEDSSNGIDLNEFLSQWYPSGWASYDEMDVAQWIDESTPLLDAEIQKLKGSSDIVTDLTEEMQDKLDSMLEENGATDYELNVDNQVVFFVDGVGHRIDSIDVIPVKDLM
jgi:hypothetical protein